ncbi:hypothetical protein BCT93_22730 [Vibrio lentus]|uniref:PEP/pyruvate-binding domain-containing protein n=1 Tax=Vibrio lentus TaxID=136468 RepID=UPI000C85CC8D|nr:PEP/pyruvate-binding domain-containing protein [Vibrio lentus]PMK67061.1 hypothetical protein BCT93_22730 [Vibrio lentus]
MMTEMLHSMEGLPGKYRHMAMLSKHHPVPPLTLVTEKELSTWLEHFDEVKFAVTKIEQHIMITSGAFLKKDLDKIAQQVRRLRWKHDATASLKAMLQSVQGSDTPLNVAVRSACQAEDLSQHSFAGIYESVLNVESIDQLKAAIIEVWCSAYSVRAIMEKLEAKVIGSAESMNMIVQQMIAPELAGVAFSCDPVTGEDTLYIEYVDGLGEALVSGEQVAKRITKDAVMVDHQQVFEQLTTVVTSAKNLLGGHVDIEWAYQNGVVYLLQARPVTNIRKQATSTKPQFACYELYDELPSSIHSELPAYALYFNRKRKPLHDIGKQFGGGEVGAVILELNCHALDHPLTQQRILDLFFSERQVIDFSDAVRQLTVPKAELIDQLKRLMTDPNRIHYVVLRDFVKGQYGVITQQVLTNDGPTLVAEVSEDGLLAMNRGSAVSQMLSLPAPDANTLFSGADLTILHDVTTCALEKLGDIQIEWVFSNGQFYALDYSSVGENPMVLTDNTSVMSPGFARGNVFVVESSEALENYSIAPSMSLTDIPDASVYGDLFTSLIDDMQSLSKRPILFSKRPYAALASLLPYVSGFVFEKGSLLCHLGVLLREKQLPAVCDEQLFHQMAHGEPFELDTVSIN